MNQTILESRRRLIDASDRALNVRCDVITFISHTIFTHIGTVTSKYFQLSQLN